MLERANGRRFVAALISLISTAHFLRSRRPPAGKTGTAQIPIPGGYDDPWTIGSFIAYAPADDPQVIILVKLDRKTRSMWGSETAVPVFHRLAERLFPALGVRSDDQSTMINTP